MLFLTFLAWEVIKKEKNSFFLELKIYLSFWFKLENRLLTFTVIRLTFLQELWHIANFLIWKIEQF